MLETRSQMALKMPASHSVNPFATCHVRPGAMPFLGTHGSGVSKMVDRLSDRQWWGEIVGPHGAGKSTLVASLVGELQRAGRKPQLYTLHDGQRRLLPRYGAYPAWSPDVQVIVDGYEQLSRWHRSRLKRAARRSRCGLLVTAHRPVGFAQLVHVRPELELVQTLVGQLLVGRPPLVSAPDVAASYAAHRGNVREIFFDLYILYERRNRSIRNNHYIVANQGRILPWRMPVPFPSGLALRKP